jgi:hypothetical protein
MEVIVVPVPMTKFAPDWTSMIDLDRVSPVIVLELTETVPVLERKQVSRLVMP